jgi:hypothetical protein
MPNDLPPDQPQDGGADEDAYAPPAALDQDRPRRRASPASSAAEGGDGVEDGAGSPEGPRRPVGLKIGIAVAVLAVVAGALLAYRSHQRSRALAEGLPKAEALLRLDTAAGYRGAADLLQPLARLDELQAGSMRAFALAMLAADYRDADAEPRAEALLVLPGRADAVPPYANLATAGLFLGRRAVADAFTYAGRAGRHPWAGTLQARIALLAGNLEAGVEPAAASAAETPPISGAHAVLGDILRRHRKDPVGARAAYVAALAASPLHPRAAYGLAKLALASQVPLADAIAPLQRLAADAQGTPPNERARAALHLAAIELRSGDRSAAQAALAGAPGLDGAGRTWAERAAAVMAAERRAYRAVLEAPPVMQSASDDDPPEASPIPPPPPPPAAAPPPPKAAPAAKKPPPKKAAVAAPAKKTPQAPAKKATTPPKKTSGTTTRKP